MTPSQVNRVARKLVASIVILTIVGLWAHGQLTGNPLTPLWQLAVLVLALASAIAVFGRRTVDDAVESAQDLKGGDQGQENDDG
jgi:hypothetical protein